MKLYRFLTGEVGLSFNRRVTAALNDGWSLYGDPVFIREDGAMLAGQAIVKETDDGADYDVRVLIDGARPDDA
jgi:hypothetical protein